MYFFSGAPVLRTAGEEFDAISMDGNGVLKLVVMVVVFGIAVRLVHPE